MTRLLTTLLLLTALGCASTPQQPFCATPQMQAVSAAVSGKVILPLGRSWDHPDLKYHLDTNERYGADTEWLERNPGYRDTVRRALDRWEACTPFTFTHTDDPFNTDIKVYFWHLPDAPYAGAATGPALPGRTTIIRINTAAPINEIAAWLEKTLRHEFGHGLGLAHTWRFWDIMAPAPFIGWMRYACSEVRRLHAHLEE